MGAVFSPKNVLRAKQMLAMDSEPSQTPSLTPHMLFETHLFLCIFTLYSKVNGTQTLISDKWWFHLQAQMESWTFWFVILWRFQKCIVFLISRKFERNDTRNSSNVVICKTLAWDRLPFWWSDPDWSRNPPTSCCSHHTDYTQEEGSKMRIFRFASRILRDV